MSEMNQQPKSVKPKMPKIRFEGFSDDWNKNRLSSVFSIFSGNAFSSKDQAEEGIIWLKIADVGIQKMTPNNLSYLPFGYENTYEKYLIKKDDVVIALTRPILNKRLKIAIAGEKYHGALLNQRVGKIVSANNHVPFIYCLLQQEKLISQFESSIAGTDPPNLSLNEIKDIPLITPNQKEQTQIGNFFQELDKLIELQTRTVELAETHKKAMLQKMFPKKGEKVPKVRFEGFSEDWQNSVLKKKAHVFIGMVTTMTTQYVENGVPLIRNSDIKPNYINQSNLINLNPIFVEENASRKLQVGDIVTVHTGDVGISAIIPNELEGSIGFATLNTRLLTNEELIPLFLACFFNTRNFLNWCISVSTGDGRTNLNLKDFEKAEILYPSIKEQTKIGHYFQELDRNIESEKQKLEQYQTMKRAMLQRMFV